ncbi:MAG TPA: AMP-binding protein [Thermoanaerobaculia bacterium]|nr:AMP-binding protein [Thermoanaerobaculia bacterium]
MNLHDLFAVPLRRAPQAPALLLSEEPGTISYLELFAAAGRLAAELRSRGLRRGDRVALLIGNRPELAVAYLAALALGVPAVPINLAYRAREIAHILRDSEPRLLLTERERLEPAREACEELASKGPEVLTVEDLVRWGGEAGEPDRTREQDEPPVAGSDPALLLYTSGTTGASKGAVLSHDNLLATVTGLLAAWGWRADDVLLLALPLFHTHGLVVGLTCALAAGAAVRLHPRFDAAAVLAELESGAASLFFGVPTMYVRLVAALLEGGERTPAPDLSRLRLCCSGSAALDPATFDAFREATGHAILERYGMTETGMLLSNLYAGERRPGSVGVPLPGVAVRLVDPAGADVPAGEQGELLVAGSNVFSGYWNAPEKTAESFLPDAAGRLWFRTGDLGRQDPATGAFSLLGRRHELIVSGGFNVYPREIEEVLAGHPGVREAAVVGRPHPEWGEVPVAFVVLADGAPAALAAAIAGGLQAFCRERLAGFKVPQAFHPVAALPRNALGKVQKHLLDQAQQHLLRE